MYVNIVKGATEIIVSAGVGTIVGNTLKQATPENAKLIKKVSVGIGAFVLSSMVGSMAAEYATTQIDRAVDGFTQARDIVRQANAQM